MLLFLKMTTKINLLDYNQKDLAEYFTSIGEKSFRATQLIKWIHQLGVTDFNLMTNFSKTLRANLIEKTAIKFPEIAKEHISKDGTRKWLFKLEDNNLIETVFIPEDDRNTLCISTQVGCPLKCDFCATGKLGFTRNLKTSEIIGQLYCAVRKMSSDNTTREHVISNVVIMGMGEPLLNFDNVVRAIDLMLDDNAYGLSKYRVTLSTAGIVPEIQRFSEISDAAFAVSLHAPNDDLRNQLMPINKKYPLKELLQACKNYFKDDKRKVTFEYILLDNVNDSAQHAKQLVKLLSNISCKINLIPFNAVSNAKYKPSTAAKIEAFRDILMQAGFNTITRKTRGADIAAACGQLKADTN